MSDSATPVLYSYWRSSSSWRVRLALSYKNIAFTVKPVHLVQDGGQQNTSEYESVNPQHFVPSLVIDGHTLTQSVAILEYLEETRPQPAILPSDPAARAAVRKLALAIAADIQPIQNLAVLQYVGLDRKMEWGSHWITRGFVPLEKMLATTAGKCCFGDEPSIADFCLIPQVYNANRFQVDMSQFPTINRIVAHIESQPWALPAHPDQQIDAQK